MNIPAAKEIYYSTTSENRRERRLDKGLTPPAIIGGNLASGTALLPLASYFLM
jgi:hypothetical protein